MKKRFVFWLQSSLIFDDSSSQLSFKTQYFEDKMHISTKKFSLPYNDVSKYELITSYSDADKSSSGALGATAGAVLLGPAGAIIGGLMGRGKSQQKIESFILKLHTDNEVYEIHPIPVPVVALKAQPILKKVDGAIKKLNEIGIEDAGENN